MAYDHGGDVENRVICFYNFLGAFFMKFLFI